MLCNVAVENKGFANRLLDLSREPFGWGAYRSLGWKPVRAEDDSKTAPFTPDCVCGF